MGFSPKSSGCLTSHLLTYLLESQPEDGEQRGLEEDIGGETTFLTSLHFRIRETKILCN